MGSKFGTLQVFGYVGLVGGLIVAVTLFFATIRLMCKGKNTMRQVDTKKKEKRRPPPLIISRPAYKEVPLEMDSVKAESKTPSLEARRSYQNSTLINNNNGPSLPAVGQSRGNLYPQLLKPAPGRKISNDSGNPPSYHSVAEKLVCGNNSVYPVIDFPSSPSCSLHFTYETKDTKKEAVSVNAHENAEESSSIMYNTTLLFKAMGHSSSNISCPLVIGTMAKNSIITGYCVNILKRKCNFYTYDVNSFPIAIFFKIFKDVPYSDGSLGEDYLAVKNVNFALFLWRQKIEKYQKLELYAASQAVDRADTAGVPQLRKYLSHLQFCTDSKLLLCNPNQLSIQQYQNPNSPVYTHDFQKYIHPNIFLQDFDLESFDKTLKFWHNIPDQNVQGTHFLQENSDNQFLASKKFGTYLTEVQTSADLWDSENCQCKKY